MKSATLPGVFAVVLALLAIDASAEVVQQTAGAVCRPATAADAAKLDYRNGAAVNVHAAPGTSAQNAMVTCALPPVPPNHFLTRVGVNFFDSDRRWTKCHFYNAYPSASRPVLVTTVPGSMHLGQAQLSVDSAEFVPHAVQCTVRPGQMLYGVEIGLEPY